MYKLERAGSGIPMGSVETLKPYFEEFRVFLDHGGKEIRKEEDVPKDFQGPIVLLKNPTPIFMEFMKQFSKEDKPKVRLLIRSFMLNKRAPKHFIIQGPIASGKTTLIDLAIALAPTEPGHLKYLQPIQFWAESLIDVCPMGTQGGVEFWTADPRYPSIFSKEKRVLVQKPVVASDADEYTLSFVRKLAPQRTKRTRMVHRKHQSTIVYHEWDSPIVVEAGWMPDLDSEMFYTIHMEGLSNIDPSFGTKLVKEAPLIRKIIL